MEIIEKYWSIIFALIGIVWHLITRYFRSKELEREFNLAKEHIRENNKKILLNEETFNNYIITASGRDKELENKILLKVEQQNKEIVLKLLDQEVRANQSTDIIKGALAEVRNAVGIINKTLLDQNSITTRLIDKLDDMERERLDDLKEQLKRRGNG